MQRLNCGNGTRTMWMIYVMAMTIYGVVGAPSSLCPESCKCNVKDVNIEAHCPSLDFLNKPLHHKLKTALGTLIVENGSISKIDPKIGQLHSLKELSFKYNKIVDINLANLPKSLKYLDLSHNYIETIPHFEKYLPKLKMLNLAENPIDCTCDSLSVRDELLKAGVKMVENVKCVLPESHRGKLWLTRTCDPFEILTDEMQQDDPDAGSGSGELIEDDNIEEPYLTERSPLLQEDMSLTEGSGNDEFNLNESVTEEPDYSEYDEESDTENPETESPVTESEIKVCYFDCTTPVPLNQTNETQDSTNIFQAVKTVLEDFNIIGSGDGDISTTTIENDVTEEPTVVVEDVIIKKTVAKEEAALPPEQETDKGNIQNVEQQSSKQSSSTFIFLGVLLVLMVVLILYAVVKKRSSKNRPRTEFKNANEKEMQPLQKLPVENAYVSQETSPLMNGQNGTHRNKVDEELPFKNNVENNFKEQPLNNDDDYVDLRRKNDDSVYLTPEAKRVTIRASELSDSIPKTPILINRHLNSQGNIVTTPSY